MTDKLLPPNPDLREWYWLYHNDMGRRSEVIATWRPSSRTWHTVISSITPEEAPKWGYSLASPHPIPSAAALNRLHDPTTEMMAVGEDILDTVGDLSEVFDVMLAEALKP